MNLADNPNSATSWNSYWQSFIREQNMLPAPGWRNSLILAELSRLHPDGMKIYEFGCGPGNLSLLMARNFPKATIVSLDQSEEALAYARSCQSLEHASENIVYLQADMLNRTQMKTIVDHYGKASVVVCSEVLEHISAEDTLLSVISDSLLDGNQGTLLLTVPGGPQSKFTLHVGHLRHYTKAYLSDILSKYFSDITIYCAGFPFFNMYKLSTILAGQSIIHEENHEQNILTKLGCRVFKYLFKFNLNWTKLGWQLLAVCKK